MNFEYYELDNFLKLIFTLQYYFVERICGIRKKCKKKLSMLNENQLNMNKKIPFELFFWKITMLIKNRSRKKPIQLQAQISFSTEHTYTLYNYTTLPCSFLHLIYQQKLN